MKIGCDIDGCLANFTDAYTELLTKESGVEFPRSSPEWPQEWYFDRPEGVTSKHRSAVWETIKTTDFWGKLCPLAGAIETLQRLNILRAAGHDIIFITSRPGKMAKFYTEQWLQLGGMQNPTVIIGDKKGPIAAALGLDVFVDDKLENCEDVLVATTEMVTAVYLIDRPYNQQEGPFTRIASVGAVLDILFPLTQMRRAA